MLDIVVCCLILSFKKNINGEDGYPLSETRKLVNTVCTQMRESPVEGSPVG